MSFTVRKLIFGSLREPAAFGAWRFVLCALVLTIAATTNAQRISLVLPERSDLSSRVAEELARQIEEKGAIRIDLDAAETAFRTLPQLDFFNLATSQAKEVGGLLGTDLYILLKTGTQRRTSLERSGYFESSATIYLVSARSGRLVYWNLTTFEAENENSAEKGLMASLPALAETVSEKARATFRSDIGGRAVSTEFPVLPEPESVEAKGLRPPVPYRRIKPEYTKQAYLFGIRATVEIEVNIDAEGSVVGTDIVRWAGYGLDESVETAVRAMNWRPAERSGKSLPSRVLLRYNFTKIENEQR